MKDSPFAMFERRFVVQNVILIPVEVWQSPLHCCPILETAWMVACSLSNFLEVKSGLKGVRCGPLSCNSSTFSILPCNYFSWVRMFFNVFHALLGPKPKIGVATEAPLRCWSVGTHCQEFLRHGLYYQRQVGGVWTTAGCCEGKSLNQMGWVSLMFNQKEWPNKMFCSRCLMIWVYLGDLGNWKATSIPWS